VILERTGGKRVVTTREFIAIFAISEEEVRGLVKSGKLRGIRSQEGEEMRFPVGAIAKLMGEERFQGHLIAAGAAERRQELPVPTQTSPEEAQALLQKGRRVYTTGQVAKICSVAPRTVSKWFDSGKLKGYRIPGSQDRRVPRWALLEFLRESKMEEHLERESKLLFNQSPPGIVYWGKETLGNILTHRLQKDIDEQRLALRTVQAAALSIDFIRERIALLLFDEEFLRETFRPDPQKIIREMRERGTFPHDLHTMLILSMGSLWESAQESDVLDTTIARNAEEIIARIWEILWGSRGKERP
jgi:excisionase family DNA binding protein